MGAKRKFSATFEADLDTVQNLMKYRKTTSQVNTCIVSYILVNQEELRWTTDSILRSYEAIDRNCGGDTKPNYTYTELIFMSILRSPNYCLPISEIYSYIETRYPFFSVMREQQWKNAVRQSLKKNKCFQKLGLENQNPRRGILNKSAFLWTLLPRCLLSFSRGDYRTKKNTPVDLFPSKCTRFSEGCITTLRERIEAFQAILNQTSNPAKLYSLQVCNMEGEDSGLQDLVSNSSESKLTDNIQTTHNLERTSALKSYFWSPNNSTYSENDSFEGSSKVIDLSTSSGYQSLSELSYLDLESDHDCISGSTDDYWGGVFDNTGTERVPELSPECIASVPCLLDIPPLNLSVTKLTKESDIDVTSFQDVMHFDDDECLNAVLNEEDFSILQEFLCF